MKYEFFINDEYKETYEDLYDLFDNYWTLENFGEEFDEFLDSTCQTLDIPYYGQAEISFVLKKLDWGIYESKFYSFMDIYIEYVESYLRNEYEMPLNNGMKIIRIDEDEEV